MTNTSRDTAESDSPKPITAAAHKRDSDGEVLSVTETVDIHGDEYQVDVFPATRGQRNEWLQRLGDEDADLADDTTADLLDEFADHEPDDFGAGSWDDVRPAITDAIGNVIMARLFDAEDTDAFIEELNDATQQAVEGNRS